MSRVAIVGGSLGGLRAAETLRAQGWSGEIVVLGAEEHLPYTRPPLSKAMLASGPELSDLALRMRPEMSEVEWRLGTRVVRADLAQRVLSLDDGSSLGYDGIVAATGVHPRKLAVPGSPTGGHVLRTIDDCAGLNAELQPGRRVLVLGAGFIGCEVAATAARLGCRVKVVALDDAPMARPLGELVGRAVQRKHEPHGVTFNLGRTVTRISHEGKVRTLHLDNGRVVDCHVLVEAIGSVPCTEWLEGNGLDLGDGVACDNWMRMGGHAGAVAVGDVARFPNPLFDDVPRRVEHWQTPAETARRAAATLLADLAGDRPDPAPFRPLPSFWSDQSDVRIQSFGAPELGDRIEVLEGDLGVEAVVGYYRADTLTGIVLLGMLRKAPSYRRELLAELICRSDSVAA